MNQKEQNEAKKVKTGTTTLGIKSKDGVVMATESQASMGHLISNKYTDKIIPIQDHIAITIAGLVSDAQSLGRLMTAETNLYQLERKKKVKVESAVTLLSNIMQGNKVLPYFVQLIVGGYDEEPKLYSMDAVGSMLEEKAAATGSGSTMAYGVLENYYDEDNKVEDNVKIALKAIHAAKERDSGSGGRRINLIKITKDGTKRYTQEEIEELKEEVNLRSI